MSLSAMRDKALGPVVLHAQRGNAALHVRSVQSYQGEDRAQGIGTAMVCERSAL